MDKDLESMGWIAAGRDEPGVYIPSNEIIESRPIESLPIPPELMSILVTDGKPEVSETECLIIEQPLATRLRKYDSVDVEQNLSILRECEELISRIESEKPHSISLLLRSSVHHERPEALVIKMMGVFLGSAVLGYSFWFSGLLGSLASLTLGISMAEILRKTLKEFELKTNQRRVVEMSDLYIRLLRLLIVNRKTMEERNAARAVARRAAEVAGSFAIRYSKKGFEHDAGVQGRQAAQFAELTLDD